MYCLLGLEYRKGAHRDENRSSLKQLARPGYIFKIGKLLYKDPAKPLE